ncbi:MAG: 50S ribosomal protein L18 [Candidatus Staskawiczbacteria bacterium]|nr:50S ribosomal protein L18 [Candidatus Staskawiczbacteria bacterium]
MLPKILKRVRRHKKIRIQMHGTKEKPRLCVFRSSSHIYAQLINDDTAKVLASASDKEVKLIKDEKMAGKVLSAFLVGKLIAKKAEIQKIEKVIFDRGGIVFHGRVKALAEGAREGGLKF